MKTVNYQNYIWENVDTVMDEEIEEDEEPKRKKKQFFLKNCVTIKNFRELELEELENLIRHSFPTPLEKYSWFSADVISLCK